MSGCVSNEDVRQDRYLTLTVPRSRPEIFLPGVVSTNAAELNSAISPSADRFLFSEWLEDGEFRLREVLFEGEAWSQPSTPAFASSENFVDPALSTDGTELFFLSNLLHPDTDSVGSWDVWRVTWNGTSWEDPNPVGGQIKSEADEFFPSLDDERNLYFTSNRAGGFGERDVYRSRYANGEYGPAEHLPRPVNSELDEGDAFIAPDGSYLLIKRSGAPESMGLGDLYVSFATLGGGWSEVISLGEPVNTPNHEHSPSVSPDGGILFFTRVVEGQGDIYWVSTDFVSRLNPLVPGT